MPKNENSQTGKKKNSKTFKKKQTKAILYVIIWTWLQTGILKIESKTIVIPILNKWLN